LPTAEGGEGFQREVRGGLSVDGPGGMETTPCWMIGVTSHRSCPLQLYTPHSGCHLCAVTPVILHGEVSPECWRGWPIARAISSVESMSIWALRAPTGARLVAIREGCWRGASSARMSIQWDVDDVCTITTGETRAQENATTP